MLLAWRRVGASPSAWGTLARAECIALQLLQGDQSSSASSLAPSLERWAVTAAAQEGLASAARLAPSSRAPELALQLTGGKSRTGRTYDSVDGYGSFGSRALHTGLPLAAQQQQQSEQQQQQPEQGARSSTAAAISSLPASWVDTYLPKSWAPYAHLMRLDKPIGTWLLAWPCFWSIALAAPPGALPDLRTLALFGTGAVLLRGAGCTVNDLWDRDLDKQVERTRGRPLAAGLVSPPQAVAFLGAQLLVGLGILLQLNSYSQLLGASSLALVATYPLMKRITGWPQAYLGLTYNWGALLGWAAVQGQCDWAVVAPLYLAGVSWTLVYDTIYAHQDKEDDVKAGIKSTALTFGAATKTYLAGFSALNVALLSAAGAGAGCGPAYYAGVAAAGGQLAWQLGSVDLDNRADCWAKFASNKWYGALLFGGILADRLLA